MDQSLPKENADCGGFPLNIPTTNCLKTVLRLKRRVEDEPAHALLLSFKRLKGNLGHRVVPATALSDDGEEVLSSVLNLAGTVPAEDEKNSTSVTDKIIAAAVCDSSEANQKCKQNVKRRTHRGPEKTKENFRQRITENRFKVISAKRKCELLTEGELGENTKEDADCSINKEIQNLYNLYDLVAGEEPSPKIRKNDKDLPQIGAITCNGIPLVKVPSSEKAENSAGSSSVSSTKETPYVFDIYVSYDPCIGDAINNQFVSVQKIEEGELVYDESEEEVAMEDEEDSNEEGNWRNDYPDSECDEDKFYGEVDSEDEIASKFKSFGIGSHEGELSSDDDEERYPIYGMDDDGADGSGPGFHSKYAAFKARIRRQEMADEVVSSESDSD